MTTKYDQTGVSPSRETPVPSLSADLLVSLRPDQWTKNLFVFAGLVFGEQLLDAGAVARSCATFTIFCALSSAMYLVNDLRDRTRDRLHPVKASRPIAVGRVSPAAAATAFWRRFQRSSARSISRFKSHRRRVEPRVALRTGT